MKILCFGNPYVEEDNIAIKVAKELKEYEIEFCDSPQRVIEEDIIILDTVVGINKVEIIDDLSKIKKRNITTLHDLDLNFFINLGKQLGKLKKIKIIGIPQKYSIKKAIKEVKELIKEQ